MGKSRTLQLLLILNTTLIGETTREKLITPRGARPGDILLLTESLPIEGTAILASEYARHLKNVLSAEELTQAQNYTFSPGIGVYRAARTPEKAAPATRKKAVNEECLSLLKV